MTGEAIGACLDRLSSALVALDGAAVGECVDDLEVRFKTGRQDEILPHAAALLVQLRHATALAVTADRLYAGWRQMAAPEGAAYVRGGDRPPPPAASNWKVDG